ncbi:hypothetical protein B6U70_01080 [Euryarchaeota archaeon ex4484_162]|nr:MAG: hypothetical protein B6U70_01080 [Euryarchaeota archaeon ex4484_162]RLF28627.1 MAG: hypothetical protein DRN05_03595 [Thermoplasmata archaeon]
MQMKHSVLILSILGIFILYLLSLFSQPVVVRLYEIPKYEGKKIVAEGVVTNYYTTNYGSQIIEIKTSRASKDNFTATVFAEKITSVEYGDRIRVTGIVQKYEGKWEIFVSDTRSIDIIQKWQNNVFPIWQLAENPDRYVGMNINITGIVDRNYETYFYLSDSDGKYSLIVFSSSVHCQNFSTGDKVYAAGRFTYDSKNLRYMLKANETGRIS